MRSERISQNPSNSVYGANQSHQCLLVNDTSYTNNPGCKETVRCLEEILYSRGFEITQRIRNGEHFDALSNTGRKSKARRIFDSLTRKFHSPEVKKTEEQEIHIAVQNAANAIQDTLRQKGSFATFVVVNGEGTIHHSMAGALVLAAWGVASKAAGKRNALVNCTLEALPKALETIISQAFDYIAVREPETYDYVKTWFPSVVLSADAIFGVEGPLSNPAETQFPVRSPSAIYSPGVLSLYGLVQQKTVDKHLSQLKSRFTDVVYLSVEHEDLQFVSVAEKHGVKTLSYEQYSSADIIQLLAAFDLVVSGRYHVCIFSILADTPFVPLASNTWKLRGLLRHGTGNGNSKIQAHGSPLDLHSKVYPESFPLKELQTLAMKNIPFAA